MVDRSLQRLAVWTNFVTLSLSLSLSVSFYLSIYPPLATRRELLFEIAGLRAGTNKEININERRDINVFRCNAGEARGYLSNVECTGQPSTAGRV